MKNIALFILALSIALPSFGQNYKLSGSVQDPQNQPIGFAEVRVYQNTDSQFVNGNLTDEAGKYEIDLAPGNYWMTVEFLGLRTDTLQVNMPASSLELPIVTLGRDVQQLEGATIIGQRNPMEFQIDKRVYNVDADLNNQGTTASEMLENIPSVTVDAEGNVSLRGNQGVRILIDGKYSGFATSADALKQLQSDRIDRVEIITNASSRYDAEGDAGIINIILKKEQKNGFSGSANVRTGYFPDNGAGFNLNYRKNNWNFYLNYNINHNINPSNSTTYQRLHTSDTAFGYRQFYESERKKLRNSASFGVDYNFNDNHQISASINARTGNGNNFYDRVYDNLNEADVVLNTDTRLEYNRELEDMYEATLGYRMKLNREGGSWNTEFRFFHDQDFENSDYSEINSMWVDSHYEKSKAHIIERYYLAQSDLILPLSNTAKMETGIRSQTRTFNNDFGFSELLAGTWEAPSQWNDNFKYNEQVHAAYLMGSNQWDKLGIQAGIRAEYTIIETLRQSEAIPNSKDYIDFFPSVALSYQTSEMQTFQLNYSKRIRRPGQWELMPFMKFGDNKEMRIGNPDVDPEMTHSFEAGWMQYFTKGTLLSSVYYRRTNNKIERMSEVGSDGIVYRIPMNIANRDAVGVELNANYNVRNWFRLSSAFNFYKETINGNYQGEDFLTDNFSWSNRSTANFSFPKYWRIQVAANYQAPRVHPQGRTLAIFHSDLGVSKDLWGQKATLGLNVRDVFNSRRWRSETNTESITAVSDFQWRPRSIRLVFTYRFNQPYREQQRNILSSENGQMEGEG